MPARHLLLAALLACSACRRREVDTAAKARIFSPEEPVGAQAGALEKLDARALAGDGRLAQRVLQMEQAEVLHRLGGHRVQSRVSFGWMRGALPLLADGGVDTSDAPQLVEEASLTQAPGGDFVLKLQNDHNQGFELVWAQGGAYVRGLFGPFRKRRTDRTDPARMREQALSALATFDRLARGLKLRPLGEGRAGGRQTVKYEVAGAGARAGGDGGRELAPLVWPERPAGQAGRVLGPDPDTARRLELWSREEPVSLSGTVLVDALTAVPLAADLSGRFRVPPERAGAPPAELELRVAFTTSEIGGSPAIAAPAFEPDPSTPHAVKDPLRFLGRAAPGGIPSTEEPVEDDEAGAPE